MILDSPSVCAYVVHEGGKGRLKKWYVLNIIKCLLEVIMPLNGMISEKLKYKLIPVKFFSFWCVLKYVCFGDNLVFRTYKFYIFE